MHYRYAAWLAPNGRAQESVFQAGMDDTKGPRAQKINKWRDMLKIDYLCLLSHSDQEP